MRHDLDQAELLFRVALEIEERLDLKEGMVIEHYNLGRIGYERGNTAQSEESLRKALKLSEETRNGSMARAAKALLEQVRKPRKDRPMPKGFGS